MKFVTVTLNPARDKTYYIDGEFGVGALNRVQKMEESFGGKGINVSRVINALGGETDAICVLGRRGSRGMKRVLENEGVHVTEVEISGQTRTNISVISTVLQKSVTIAGLTDFCEKRVITEINEPGPTFNEKIEENIIDAVRNSCMEGDVLVISGSIPPGCSKDIYARLIAIAREKSVLVALDCSGDSLKIALEEKPDIIKPNINELSELAGVVISDEIAACRVASIYAVRNGINVLATLDKRGSVLATPDGKYIYCPAVPVEEKRVKGAGDTFLGAFLWAHSQKYDVEESLKIASRAASALISIEQGYPTREEFLSSGV